MRLYFGILTYPRQLTYAHTLHATFIGLIDALARTLRGPFDGLFHIRLSASRTLCSGIAAVISASTVSIIIAFAPMVVKREA